MSILVEIALMRDDLIPELSYGSHFFQDLVETDIFYAALFPEKEDVCYNISWFENCTNELGNLSEDGIKYQDVVKVYDNLESFFLMSDVASQKLYCFTLDPENNS